jgi:DNA-binding PadR family transcriptional regulator
MSRANQFSRPDLPLTPPVFSILLSLSLRERHGYDILKHVRDSSGGAVRLGPGTLYTTIKRLLEAGLVVEATTPDQDDPRRRYYRLTDAGRRRLDAEIARMELALRLARAERAGEPAS